MEKAARQKYPDGPFPAPEPLVRVRLCSVSNRIATDACAAAGDSYEIMLPQSMVPAQTCPVHTGRELGESGSSREQRGESQDFTGHLLRSLRRLFGG
jgi:hypothetical protein